MEQVFELLSGPLDDLARTGAPQPIMIALALVMFGGWAMTYFTIIKKSFKDKTYGIPIPNTCLNASWELIFSFNLAGGLPPFAFPLRFGHLIWLIPNSVNIYQTVRFGPRTQTAPLLKRYFHHIFVLTFIVAFLLIFHYHFYARDVYGVASSWIINVLMSWLFIRMLLNRWNRVTADGTIEGMSVRAAWYKLIGNAAGAVFCVFWWPAQFIETATVTLGNTAVQGRAFMLGDIVVQEPRSYFFLYVLYGVNLALDVWLIVMLRRREAAIRSRKEVTLEHAYQLV